MANAGICWICFNSGVVLDAKEADGKVVPGGMNVKPCPCGILDAPSPCAKGTTYGRNTTTPAPSADMRADDG